MPGTVGGLEYAREKYGTLSRADLIDPAIGYAENGFVLDDGDALLLDDGGAGLARRPRRGGDLPQPRPAVRASAIGWCRRISRAR